MKRQFIFLFIVCTLTSQILGAKDAYWPREIRFSQGTITLYQPQPESLKGNNLHGRAAVMVKQKKEGAPVFGAFWFDANMFTDRDERMVTLESITIRKIKFPEEIDSDREQEIRSILETEIPKMSLEFQLDELLSTIEQTNSGKTGEEGLNNDPPEVIIRNKPAVLITIDGEPRTEAIEGSGMLQVVNTPYFIVYDPQNREYWLYGDGMWFVTNDVLRGSWRYNNNPRSAVKELIDESENQSTATEQASPIPEIVVRSTPAELVVTDGEPDFAPIEGSGLLYVTNTQSDVFMNTGDQSYYILLSGRWYVSKSMKGPWTYVAADQLPNEFSAIPEGSSKDRVLASVAGTDAANEAVLDAIIPQTASVNRNEATVNVTYDGNPNFVNIPGTRVAYADNSGTTVLLISNRFYACDNGIWFESDRATGPWIVCVNVPRDVQDIPPSSPVHNVKYVYVYDYTPDIVYVGYTPGYTGCYIYGPTVVYGTGFYYHSWYGVHYYPRPCTYGYHMYYDPYMGWVIGFYTPYWRPSSWYTCYYYHPHYHYHYYGGYWGPPAYPPPYHHYYSHYYGSRPVHPVAYYEKPRINPSQNVYYQHRTGVETSRRVMGPSENARSSLNTRRTTTGEGTPTQTSARRSEPQTTGRTTTTRTSTDSRTSAGQTSTTRTTTRQSTRNNVYTDEKGDVYRRTDQEWQKRENSSWQPATRQSTTQPATAPAARTTTNTRPSAAPTSRSDLDRQQYSRERGEQRSTNARATRSATNARSSTPPATNKDRTQSQQRTTPPEKR
jgi:hypothetical protein